MKARATTTAEPGEGRATRQPRDHVRIARDRALATADRMGKMLDAFEAERVRMAAIKATRDQAITEAETLTRILEARNGNPKNNGDHHED